MNLETIHNNYSNEYKIATRAFYTWKLINNIASNDSEVYGTISRSSNTWNIILYSLQSTYFIALRRIFDDDVKSFSVDYLLKYCIDNISEFGKDKIKERKIGDSKEKPEWLDEYLEKVHQIELKDLLQLRGELSKQKNKFKKVFKPITNKIFAHREIEYLENSNVLFVNTKIACIEEILDFLFQLDMILFDLFHNGRLGKIGSYQSKEEELITKDIEQLFHSISA